MQEIRYTSTAQLREALGSPSELAERKAVPALDKYSRAFIARSPFLTLASTDATGR
ncbi:MAG: hypothetical protein RL434_1909, partial [Pseudomonadota bacterium]